ncbi:MAG: AIPR protein, partial [Candidatus Kapaibacterium sp.]
DIASSNDSVIPLSVAAQAIYAIWKEQPHLAKFKRKELFGSLYDRVYTKDLNAAQVVIAVLIYRYCDNQRRKVSLIEEFPHIPYSNYFMSMIIGKLLLSRTNVNLNQLTHKNFETVRNYFEANKDTLFSDANTILVNALNSLYKEDYKYLNMERLSSTFRRGDLYGQINFQYKASS